ncbi:MAG: DsrE family protein [Betaproteobacteria bacterium]|nr:DsrE family protein [Betaproteobacteria bacterium]
MKSLTRCFAFALPLVLAGTSGTAAEPAACAPTKVVYDFSSASPASLKNLLDRVSMLQNLYASDPFAASIVVVVHEGAVPLFARGGPLAEKELATRAQNLALGEIIQFRLCQASASMQGFGRKDFDAFIGLVPMADAEIAQLQHKGDAYLH